MANINISPEVLDVLRRSTITENLLVLPEQLERDLYVAVNKTLLNSGGLWSKKQRGHLFQSDPREKLGLALKTGVSVDEKKTWQASYTPADLARRVVELADVKGKVVLEPEAGEGALVRACVEAGALAITAVELNAEACVQLRRVAGPVKPTIYEADFLAVKLRAGDFERVVMNPPFAKNQDIKHVQRALTFLAPGGILVAIMSPNTARSGFQELIGSYDYDIEEVPAGTFKESGTNIATIILTIRK